jgi:hypothetical protein
MERRLAMTHEETTPFVQALEDLAASRGIAGLEELVERLKEVGHEATLPALTTRTPLPSGEYLDAINYGNPLHKTLDLNYGERVILARAFEETFYNPNLPADVLDRMARSRADEPTTDSGKRMGEPGVEDWGWYGLVDAGLRTQDDDLWLVEPTMRFELEGEEAVEEWRVAESFASGLAEGLTSSAIGDGGGLNRATTQLLWDLRERAQEALRRAEERVSGVEENCRA